MDGYGRCRLGGVGRCEEKTIVGRIGRRPPLRSSGFRVLLVLFYSIQKLGTGSCTKLLVCGAPHTTHIKLLLLSYTAVDASHNAFLCLCAIEISKNILPVSIYFKSCICINGPALLTPTGPPACRHPDMIACEQSWPSLICSRSAGLTWFNVRDAV